ncbi:MAG: S1C family serine protease, partial [Spirochaetota bacterium]|nr:S1C family serine protease [Spirochaetota bacterium]
MSIKRFVFFLLITATVSSIYFLSFGSELYNNLKILVNADGQKGHGFYVHQTGLLVTDHAISENFVELKISQSTSVTEKALVVKKLPFQGFSLLAAEATSRTLYSLGDSDSVDIGDKIHIPGSYSGKIVSKRNNFGDYHYPCFTTDLPADKNNVGKPVLNINNKIIGLYISFRNKHLLVPINRVKPLIKQHNQVKKLFSFPGEEIGDNLANKALLTKGYSIISEDNSWKNNLLPLTQYGGNPDFSFGHIKDMAFDQKNNLYVIDSVYNEIKKISLSSVLKEGGDNGWTLYPPNPSSTDLLEPRGSDITEPTTADTTTDTGIKPDDTAETKDPKDNDKAKTPPPPSHTKTVDLERPVSVTVSYAGLIFVLDHGLEEIVIFNEDLKIVHRFNYKKIAGHFNPVLIRAYGDKIYAITDTDRLYRMTFRKTSEEFVATNIKFIHDRWLTANIIDFDYNKDHFFWLDNKKKLIRVMNRKQKISKSLRLNMDTPRS